MSSSRMKIPVHIEAEVSNSCNLPIEDISSLVKAALKEQCAYFQNGLIHSDKLVDIVAELKVCDLLSGQQVPFFQADLFVHAFRLVEQPPENDYLEGEEELPVAEQLELPNKYLHGLWESIVIDESIKQQLLSYSCTSILFAESQIDPNIISWNKMLLLYGPPGTGKTSLCKSLAHKVFIRNSQRFKTGLMFEVNCHSLFSKWFSESGKLVMKLFSHISEIAEDPECLVVLLVDEVESIASARTMSSKSGEPGDAIRVVNAVLTSLDSLKRKSNVLVLCTSNMVSSLDEAFLDRLDFKVCIGLPKYSARLKIILSCLSELVEKSILLNDITVDVDDFYAKLTNPSEVFPVEPHSLFHSISLESFSREIALEGLTQRKSLSVTEACQLLQLLVSLTEGVSGRSLRKLPLKAHTIFQMRIHIQLSDFLVAMIAMVKHDTPADR